MLRSLNRVCLLSACGLGLMALPIAAESVNYAALGRAALLEEVVAWDIDVRPDGAGLPVGRGDVLTGEEVYTEACAMCHGDFGEAVGRWPVLAGGFDTLDTEDPVKTIGSYWPYLSTVFDYVNRAMPFGNARSLSSDDVYAITAYLLYLNDLVDEDFELNNENFAAQSLPNEENFFMDDRANVELATFSGDVCMSDCKESVEITKHATVVDVTPEQAAAREAKEEAKTADPEPLAEASVEVAVAQIDPELVSAGEKVFKKCKACHQVGDGAKNKTGPHLNDLAGRVIGSVEGFRYSKAFNTAQDAGRVWDNEALYGFLAKPKSYIKGTKMSFAGLKKDRDIEAVLAYLAATKEQ